MLIKKKIYAATSVYKHYLRYSSSVGGKPIIEVGATPEKYVQIIEEQLLK